MNGRLIPAITTLAAAALLLPARADFYQAPCGPGGTWRIYETPRPGLTFKAALAAARASTDPVFHTVHGDLASVTSAEKNTFLFRTVGRHPSQAWIGLTDREGVAPGAFEAGTGLSGWAWTNGDPFSFQSFSPGEPNNFGTGEDAVQFRADGFWNDHKSGCGANDPVTPTIVPGSSTDETTGALVIPFMVEYPVNSPSPLPGIRFGRVFPPSGTLPLAPNTAGNWSVREYRGLPVLGNTHDAVDKMFAPFSGVSAAAQRPYLDFADPFNSANGGPVLTTAPFPFLTNDYLGPNLDDDGILAMARTRIHIDAAKAGIYTIQVRADDGFAMRIKGVPWLAVNADRAYIDPFDPTALVYERSTPDTDTRATINLAAGDYDVEFLYWEQGGGAYYEVTSTSGDALAGDPVAWQPLGSTTDITVINAPNTVYLSENTRVYNANLRDRGNVLPAVRWLTENTAPIGQSTKTELRIPEGDMPNNNGGDYYITKVTGYLTLKHDLNGNGRDFEATPVTFRLNCNEGASMRIKDFDFVSASAGCSLKDNGGDMTLTADFLTNDTDARGLIYLREGYVYSYECYTYDYTGDSRFELYWQLGDNVASNLWGASLLRYDDRNLASVQLLSLATVKNYRMAYSAPFLDAARAIVSQAIPQGVTDNGTTPILLMRDSDDICCDRPGNAIYPQSVVMPNGGPDYYLTRLNGPFVVDNQNGIPGETITLTFAVFSDDGAELHISEQDFNLATDYSPDGNATLADVGGDTVLRADYISGNTHAMGRISLVEGTYTLEATAYEFGGDSGLEIWWAAGDQTGAPFNAAVFKPLSTDPGVIRKSYGIPLVAAVDPDSDHDGIPGWWESLVNQSDVNAADALLDSDRDGVSNLDEYLAGTNPLDASSHFEFTGFDISGGSITVRAGVVADRYYTLYTSPDMTNWKEAGRALTTSTGQWSWPLPVSFFPGPRVFFRATVSPVN